MLTISSFCMLSTNLEPAGISFIQLILEQVFHGTFQLSTLKCFHENHSSTKASQTCWPCQQIRSCTSTYFVHTLNTKKICFNPNSLNTLTRHTQDIHKTYPLVRNFICLKRADRSDRENIKHHLQWVSMFHVLHGCAVHDLTMLIQTLQQNHVGVALKHTRVQHRVPQGCHGSLVTAHVWSPIYRQHSPDPQKKKIVLQIEKRKVFRNPNGSVRKEGGLSADFVFFLLLCQCFLHARICHRESHTQGPTT